MVAPFSPCVWKVCEPTVLRGDSLGLRGWDGGHNGHCGRSPAPPPAAPPCPAPAVDHFGSSLHAQDTALLFPVHEALPGAHVFREWKHRRVIKRTARRVSYVSSPLSLGECSLRTSVTPSQVA